MSDELFHTPVLKDEVLYWLLERSPEENQKQTVFILDATLGGGGHTEAILRHSSAKVIGIDQDGDALQFSRIRLEPFQDRLFLERANFRDLQTVLRRLAIERIDGVLFDLGVSSHQIDQTERGFSFQSRSTLDMRMDTRIQTRAEHIINTYERNELADLIFRYGEEKHSRAIARAIVERRKSTPITQTNQLAELTGKVVKGPHSSRSMARVFQAFRIEVNHELEALKQGLESVIPVVTPGSRIVVISYHSLEDRIVKELFKRESMDCICPPEVISCVCGHRASLKIVTRKPIRPSDREVQKNRRSASAKLRAAEKI